MAKVTKKAGQKHQSGAGLVEYSLIVALISVAAILAIGGLGQRIADEACRASYVFTEIANGNSSTLFDPSIYFNKQTSSCEASSGP
jgi:Flp pilus assembly pilin Flp